MDRDGNFNSCGIRGAVEFDVTGILSTELYDTLPSTNGKKANSNIFLSSDKGE